MEQVLGPQTPYEVYCFSCQVSFPVEKRRCVHCGGRLTGRGQASPDHELAHPLVDLEEDDPEENASARALRRFGGLAVWTLVAASAFITNVCRGE